MHAWKRTFWAVWTANLVAAVGMMSFLPFFPAYLRELGVREPGAVKVWTGLVFGAAPLAAACMGPIWGALGDRLGRKLMVLRAMLGIAAFVGLMGLARGPLELLALRLLQGAFSGYLPPSITLVSVAAPADRQGGVAGSMQSAMAVGAVVGPLLGAGVQARWGMRATFAVVALLAAASTGLVALLAHEDARARRGHAGASLAELVRGSARDLVELWGNRRLRRAVLLLFCVQFGLSATNPQLQLYVEELWKGDPARVPALTATLFTLLSLMQVVALPVWGRLGDRSGHRASLQRSAWLAAAGLAAHAAAPSYGTLWPARLLLGGGSAGTAPATFGLAALESSVDRRGGAMGAVFASRALAVAVSAAVGGFVADWMGIRTLYVLSAAAVAAVLLAARGPGAGRAADPHGVGLGPDDTTR